VGLANTELAKIEIESLKLFEQARLHGRWEPIAWTVEEVVGTGRFSIYHSHPWMKRNRAFTQRWHSITGGFGDGAEF
jgi:hypothetical protein